MRTSLLTFIISIVFIACKNKQEFSISFSKPQLAEGFGQSPFLAKDSGGELFLSWIEMSGDSSNQLCYTPFRNEEFFQEITRIPGSENIQPHGENLPKILIDKQGSVFAFWGIANPSPKNKYSGKILYSSSPDKGISWTEPAPISSDSNSIDQRYFDLVRMPSGAAAVVWLDNRKTSTGEGAALFMAEAGEDRQLHKEARIAEPCCPCCRTDFFIDSKENLHVVYRGIWQDSIRDMVHIVSRDLGKTFSKPQRIHEDNWVINACPHTGPAISESGDELHFTWFTGAGDGGVFYTNAAIQKKNSAPVLLNARGSHPQIAAHENGLMAIVWDEAESHHHAKQKRIAIEIKNALGETITRDYLETGHELSGFPVVQPFKDGFIIAYTNGEGRTAKIGWQIIKISQPH